MIVRTVRPFTSWLRLRRQDRVRAPWGVLADSACEFEGMSFLGAGTELSCCSIGRGTYFSGNARLWQTRIGRYCSLGLDLLNLMGRHPTTGFATTHPAFFSTQKQAGFTYADRACCDEVRYADADRRHVCVIGHDVWLGGRVTLLDGVSIGSGAIVGAGAVVTKDLPPYSISVGVPARTVSWRFEPALIERLLAAAWWDREPAWLQRNQDAFVSAETLLERLGDSSP